MTRTEELLALAEAVCVPIYLPDRTVEDIQQLKTRWISYREAANPETIKQLAELVTQFAKAANGVHISYHDQYPAYTQLRETLEAFNKWENGE